MTDENTEIEKLTDDLTHQFEIDLITGLDACENTIKGNDQENQNVPFHKYLDKLQNQIKRCSCYASWSGVKTLSVKCRTCSQEFEKTDDTKGLLCLPCFLNGSHEGHDVQIVYSTSGNCCCGNCYFMKPEGFCSKHSIPEEHPENTELDHRSRISMISVCKTLLKHLIYYSNFEPVTFSLILKWLQRLIFIGDATRRCVSIAFSQTINLFELYQNSVYLSRDKSDLLLLIVGSLINDDVFRSYFLKSYILNLDHFIWLNSRLTLIDFGRLSLIQNNDPNASDILPLTSAVQLYTFSYQSMPKVFISELIRKKQLDWLDISIKSLNIIHGFIFSTREKIRRFGFLDIAQKQLLLLIDVGLKQADKTFNSDAIEPNDSEILNFIDQFSAFCRKCEITFPISRNVYGDKMNDPLKLQTIVFEFFFNIFTIIQTIKNESIISDTPLFLLDDYLTNDLNGNKIDQGVPGSIYEHSVLQKGVTFSQVYPLHLLAFYCYDLTKPNSREDIAEKVTSNDADLFLKKWLLMPLRYLAACDLNQFDFFIRNDVETINVINSLRYKNNIGNNFTAIFSLIQLILLLHKNKEEILEIICHTYGLFLTSKKEEGKEEKNVQLDNDESELMEKQIHGRLFAFLHFICSLIFDDLCLKRDFFEMRKLAVMTHLKFRMSGMNVQQIDEVWPNHPMNDVKFIEDLPNFTTQITGGSSGTIYKLKSDIKWHPILPFLDTGLILQAIQDFCNKNPSSLIPFPEIPDDSKFNEDRTSVLFQPLLFAFEFLILSTYSNFQELLQLTLNLLVITNKSDKKSSDSSDNQEQEIIALNLLDFVNKLSGISFNRFLHTKIAIKSQNKSKDSKDNNNNSNNSNSNSNTSNSNNNNSNSGNGDNQINNDVADKKEETEASNAEKEDKKDDGNKNDDNDNDDKKNDSNEIKLKSVIDLLLELGEIGKSVIDQLNIHIETNEDDKNSETKSNENDSISNTNNSCDDSILAVTSSTSSTSSNKSNKANLLKMQIMQNFKNQQKTFSDANDVNADQDSSNVECCVCGGSTQQKEAQNADDFLFYPCLSYKTVIPAILQSQSPVTKTSSLRICMHPIHIKCVDIEQNEEEEEEGGNRNRSSASTFAKKQIHFQCPIDRCPRNCLLPIITTEFEPIPNTNPIYPLLVNFVSAAYGSTTFIVDIVRSYASEIELLEIRSRDDPAALDSLSTQTTIHLVYLAIWHTRSNEADYILEHDDETITPFMKYILFLISLGPRNEVDPHEIIRAISKSISQMSKIVILIRFLRCCAIFDYYARSMKKSLEDHVQQFIASHKPNNNKNDKEGGEQKSHKEKRRRHRKKGDKGQHIGNCIATQIELSSTKSTNKGTTDNNNNNNNENEGENGSDENILKSSSSYFSTDQLLNTNNNNDDDDNDSNDDNILINDDDANSNIDWEVVLSAEFLFSYYGLGFSTEVTDIIKENSDVLFPPFDFVKLPKYFLDFMKDDSFKVDISTTREGEIALCLFTRKLVTLPNSVKNRTANTPPSVSDFLKMTLKKTFSAFLVLNGPQASSVIICDLKTNKIIRIKGFYVDEFDDEDPGLKRGHILTLSQSKKKETIDNILSGNWTNYRTW